MVGVLGVLGVCGKMRKNEEKVRFMGQNSISTNRDGSTANGRAKAFLTTFVWASPSEHEFLVVILAVKDASEPWVISLAFEER